MVPNISNMWNHYFLLFIVSCVHFFYTLCYFFPNNFWTHNLKIVA